MVGFASWYAGPVSTQPSQLLARFSGAGRLLLGGTRRVPASPAGASLAQLPCGLTQLLCLHALFLPAASQRPHAAVLAPVLWSLSPHTFPSSPQSCQKLVCPGLSLLPLCCLGFFCLCFVPVISVGQKMTACSQSDTLDSGALGSISCLVSPCCLGASPLYKRQVLWKLTQI